MAKFDFQDLSFYDNKESIRVIYLKLFYFDIPKIELESIAPFKIAEKSIEFDAPDSVGRKFNFLLEKGFCELKNKLNDKPTVYIHKNSSIPLMGYVAFGLIDRGTNLIEVKPITSCNLKCIYCSVDEDKRPVDFVIEEEYLVAEFKKLVEFKRVDNIDAHIAAQGEPLLYEPLVDLVRDIHAIKEVKNISIDTNGILLDERKVDALVSAGLTQFNLSIDSMDSAIAKKMADSKFYNIDKVKKIAEYIAKKASLVITPLLLPGVNDDEIPKIIEFAKKINARLGIQNFLTYRLGRNPVKQLDWDEFYARLRKWEEEYGIKLILDESSFKIVKTKEMDKPFKLGSVEKVDIVCPGRLAGEKLAVARGRIISIPNCDKEGRVRVKITRTKHNIFIGELKK